MKNKRSASLKKSKGYRQIYVINNQKISISMPKKSGNAEKNQ